MKTSNQLNEAVSFFINTMAELAILFVLVSFVVSIVNHYLPTEKVKQLLSGNKGYTTAISLGAFTPFCSCSTIPMLIGLLKARAQFGPVMAFLFTSPLLNPFIVSLFWVTFGAQITLLYSFFAIAMAGLAGTLLQYFHFEQYIKTEVFEKREQCQTSTCDNSDNKSSNNIASTSCCSSTPKKSKIGIVNQLLKETFNQLKTMLPYMLVGVAVGAVLHGFVPTTFFSAISNLSIVFIIPLSALIGVFLYVRASTMLPIAASLVGKGMSIGSVMSLTIAGAGASLPEMIMLKRLFHWQLLAAFILTVFATACVSGFAIELLM
ncbi:MAG: permease [Gammaproteobacteria bacterium]|nr:permease [Gammaproteobacteria bacterium]